MGAGLAPDKFPPAAKPRFRGSGFGGPGGAFLVRKAALNNPQASVNVQVAAEAGGNEKNHGHEHL